MIFTVPAEWYEFLGNIDTLASLRGASRGDILLDLAFESYQKLDPEAKKPTPQRPTNEVPQSVRIRVKWAERELEPILEYFPTGKGVPEFRRDLMERAKALILQLSTANERLRDGTITDLVERGLKVLDEGA